VSAGVHGLKKGGFMRVIYDKLVRDKILETLRKKGLEFFGSTIKDFPGRNHYLRKKVVEEALEVQGAKTREQLLEELADLHSTLSKLLTLHKIPKAALERAIKKKDAEKGGFDHFHLLGWVEEPDEPSGQQK
jgi:predicted house-cleaning noncanonical NTP pyrophosphatase (MazG superfamily)